MKYCVVSRVTVSHEIEVEISDDFQFDPKGAEVEARRLAREAIKASILSPCHVCDIEVYETNFVSPHAPFE